MKRAMTKLAMPHPPAVTQISIGRFHHFHLARQLEAWIGRNMTNMNVNGESI
jgi:hypothetical protein